MAGIYDFSVKGLNGGSTSLGAYRGRPMLIVNVASKCGFTPQYRGLESLYRGFSDKGFVVLGFPCNQFGHQEPGDAAEIRNFCSTQYAVSFPMFAKIEVNGNGAEPLYQYLKKEARGIFGTERIKWNFTKFLIDRNGSVIKRYAPTVRPQRLEADVASLL